MDANTVAGFLNGEFVAFDVETTGFSPYNDRMTEISALLIRGGEAVSGCGYHTLINPQKPIPYNVGELTGITDETVADAPLEGAALRGFYEFAGVRTLVAHNAKFDMGFIKSASRRCGFKCDFVCLDTLEMARFLYPHFENHKLGTLAGKLRLGNFTHHRAEADAAVLSSLFLVIIGELEKKIKIDSLAALTAKLPNAVVK